VSGPLGLALVMSLGVGVLWLASRGLAQALRSDPAGLPLRQLLLLLFAWSFVLGAVIRWVRLSQ